MKGGRATEGETPADAAFPRRDFRLELGFARDPAGETYLAHQYAAYPFHICRPFRYARDPAGMASVYLQSSSGGIYEGERLTVELSVAEGAAAHVTTQAATLVRSMDVGEAEQVTSVTVGAGGFLEYLPDPTILFPGANLANRVRLVVAPDAVGIVGESFLAHDPAGQGRPFGRLSSELTVERPDGRVLARDRFEVAGRAPGLFSPAVCADYPVHGMIALASPGFAEAAQIEAFRAALVLPEGGRERCYVGVSALPGEAGLWLRVLARDGVAMKKVFDGAWVAARVALTGETPLYRRK